MLFRCPCPSQVQASSCSCHWQVAVLQKRFYAWLVLEARQSFQPVHGQKSWGTEIEVNSTLTTRRNCKDYTPLSWAMRAVFPGKKKKKKMQKIWAESQMRQATERFSPTHPPSPLSLPLPPSPRSVSVYAISGSKWRSFWRLSKWDLSTTHGIVFWLQLLGATTEGIQTGKIKGKNVYVFYQSFVIKLVVKYWQWTRQIRYERWCIQFLFTTV